MLDLLAGRSKRPTSAYVLDAQLADGGSNVSSDAWRLYLETVYSIEARAILPDGCHHVAKLRT